MKALHLLTLSVFMSLSLLGCNDSAPPTNNDTANNNTKPTASSKINSVEGSSKGEYVSPLPDSAPLIKVGTEANYTPFEFKDEYGRVVGFDVDIMRAIGENQGFKVEILNDPWEELFDNLDDNKRDMIVAGLGNNEERQEKYGVSNPYINSETHIAYANKLPDIKSASEFKKLRVAGVTDTNVNKTFEENENIKVEGFPTLFLAIQAMTQGKVDAIIADSNVLRYSFSELGLTPKYYVYEQDNSVGEYTGIFFLVDKDKPELLTQVNRGLDAIVANGTYAKLTEKWFGTDLTEDLIKLNEERQKVLKEK